MSAEKSAEKTSVPALVLEGGGFRGLFTAGVLDVLQERGLTGFSSVWGVSAGAINASNFRSRQIGRTMRDILAFRDDRRFMSLWSFATTGDVANADFMYDEVQHRLDPCDEQTFNERDEELPMWVVVSDVTFGMPDYLPVRRYPEDLIKVRASASLPTVSRIVEIDGHRYLDGGTTDSIPYETALGLPDGHEVEGHVPAERALVVLTQDRSYVRGAGSEALALKSHRYDRYPYYLEALRTRAERYNARRQRLWQLEREGRCLVVAPEEPVRVGSTTKDGETLLTLYIAGRRQAEARLAEIDAFLNGE